MGYNLLILISILVLILAPRPLTGLLDERLGQGYAASGAQAAAASAYQQAAQRLPWQPGLWEKAGVAAQQAGDPAGAIVYLKQAAARNALSSEGWLAMGLAEQAAGHLPSALQAWKQARPLAEAYRQLALAERASGALSAALEDWRLSLRQEPRNAAALYQAGLLELALTPAQALPDLMQAAQLDPALDPTVQALRSALNAALLSPDPAYRLVLAGRALGATRNWDLAAQAVLAFQKAAALEPQDPGWQMALGGAYEQSGDLVAALEHYQQAVGLAPNQATAWRALAEFSLRNSVDLAGTGLSAARRLVELVKGDWQADDLAGQILLDNNDTVGAEALLKQAVELDPTQAAPALHLGVLYLQTGNRAAAYSYLNQAKVFDPNGSNGWQAKRLLEQYFP